MTTLLISARSWIDTLVLAENILHTITAYLMSIYPSLIPLTNNKKQLTHTGIGE